MLTNEILLEDGDYVFVSEDTVIQHKADVILNYYFDSGFFLMKIYTAFG